MSQISAAANDATPMNSLIRRDTNESANEFSSSSADWGTSPRYVTFRRLGNQFALLTLPSPPAGPAAGVRPASERAAAARRGYAPSTGRDRCAPREARF